MKKLLSVLIVGAALLVPSMSDAISIETKKDTAVYYKFSNELVQLKTLPKGEKLNVEEHKGGYYKYKDNWLEVYVLKKDVAKPEDLVAKTVENPIFENSYPVSRGESRELSKVIEVAFSKLGSPYVWAATGPDSFDCSGFTYFAYQSAGYKIPRNSAAQFDGLKSVDYPMIGDLVFFDTSGKGVSHVGIYIGEDKFIHASSSAEMVTISELSTKYYKDRYLGAKTVLR